MDAEWIKSPHGRRVIVHWADARPAWFWSGDGERLLWRNSTARYFHGRIKKGGVRLAPETVPIRGQIARLIRLGATGRSSLSRIQFLAGDRPVSTTCTVTPLDTADGEKGLLIVGVDPIEPELLDTPSERTSDPATESLFPPGAEYLLVDEDGQIAKGSPEALERFAPVLESEGLPDLDDADRATVAFDGTNLEVTRFQASPRDAALLLFQATGERPEIAAVRKAEGIAALEQTASLPTATAEAEPLLPLGLAPVPAVSPAPLDEDQWSPPTSPVREGGALSSLFDRLADDKTLFGELSAADEQFVEPRYIEPLPPSPEPEPEVARALDAAAAETFEGDDAAPLFQIPDADEFAAEPVVSAEDEHVAEPVDDPAVADEPENDIRQSELEPVVEPPLAAPEANDEPISDGGDSEVRPDTEPVEEPVPEVSEAPQTSADVMEPTAPATEFVAAELEVPPELEPVEDGKTPQPESDVIAAVIAFSDDPEESDAAIWRVVGRGFKPLSQAPSEPVVPVEAASESADDARPLADVVGDEASATEPAGLVDVPITPPVDVELVERTSRYNFDELSRILTDRVNTDAPAPDSEPRPRAPDGVVSLAAETLVLNRLPLGIMIFRDQQILFANRALMEITGHESVERLRAAGLGAVFPSAEASAGPVTQLLRVDGALTPVSARLQSINWNGRTALMLSANPVESKIGHEGAVRNFVELEASVRGEGYVLTDRAGIVTSASAPTQQLLGADIVGRALAAFIEPGAVPELQRFLNEPARYAGTTRPSVVVKGAAEGTELVLFTEGQAGTVAGYFGFVRKLPDTTTPTAKPDPASLEPPMLARVSRSVRRPLSTVIGFADLIQSSAFGKIENERYLSYARDIKVAGQEIAVLIDELDECARLQQGSYAARPADIDLAALLDSCVQRVRSQAGAARVLVRSAISEHLPRITADRASLGQAVLNLLASAIDQTPVGGSVVLSAQSGDDGSVIVNVRDSAAAANDLGERFVVFRDGLGKDGEALAPVRSSVGLALTRSLLAVNSCALSVDPATGAGTVFSLVIPADLVTPQR